MTSTLPTSVDPKAVQEVLDGRWAHVRRDARENLRDPDFLPVYGESMQDARDRVTRAARKLAESGRVGFGFPKEYGGEDDSGRWLYSCRDDQGIVFGLHEPADRG